MEADTPELEALADYLAERPLLQLLESEEGLGLEERQ